ncbi:MAG: dethiobiotin synthase [Betaproteobacteria bacterium]
MNSALFITGTDTGIGKTHVAVALLHALAASGLRAVGMKPVAAGVDARDGMHADVAALVAASNVDAPRAQVNPYCFDAAIAPHVAARLASRSIDLGVIEQGFRALAARADVVIVEGAGGALVPLSTREDMLDLPARLDIAVVLVVGIRLGCINHALLTASAIRARGLRFAGWIANRVDPAMQNADDSIAAIADRLGRAPAADLAFAQAQIDAATLAALEVVGAGVAQGR